MSNKYISQIFLNDNSEDLPEYLMMTSNSVRSTYKDHKYQLFTNTSLYDFIRLNYEAEVLWAYESLVPYSYKSDLGRFCILYKYGGWYFDIGLKSINKYEVKDNINMVCFRDEQRHSKTSWAVAGGAIWATKGNIVFKTAIESVIRNCRERWYGRTPLCPTGPALFGESIAKENRGQNIIFGDLIRPMFPFTRKNFPYLKRYMPSKLKIGSNTIAHLKPAKGGDLTKLGVKGSNNYNELWENRAIYNNIEFFE